MIALKRNVAFSPAFRPAERAKSGESTGKYLENWTEQERNHLGVKKVAEEPDIDLSVEWEELREYWCILVE